MTSAPLLSKTPCFQSPGPITGIFTSLVFSVPAPYLPLQTAAPGVLTHKSRGSPISYASKPGPHSSTWSGPLCFSDLMSCLVFSARATLASLLFLTSTKLPSTPGPLHSLCPLLGSLHRSSGVLPPLLRGSAQILSERLPHLSALCKEVRPPPLCSLAPILSLLSLHRTWPHWPEHMVSYLCVSFQPCCTKTEVP